jgi:hypothetical protein
MKGGFIENICENSVEHELKRREGSERWREVITFIQMFMILLANQKVFSLIHLIELR